MGLEFVFEPHDGQRQALHRFGRFNVLACGRRFGKTVLAKFLIMQAFSEQKRVAYYVPSSAYYDDVWRDITDMLQPFIQVRLLKVRQDRKTIESRTNDACIHLHSNVAKEAGRGKEYDRIVVDEAAFCQNLKYSWEYVMRATLIDRIGDAYFLCSPNGIDNYFYTLSTREKEGREGWTFTSFPTWENPRIPISEIESYKLDLPEKVYLQEIAAQFVDTTGAGFFYELTDGHKTTTAINPDYPLWFSFDFNVDPCSVIVGQKINEHVDYGGGCFIHNEHQMQGSTRNLCRSIWPMYRDHPAGFFITGDATGVKTDTTADTLMNNFETIVDEFGISEHLLINTSGKNPLHQYSSNVCNTALFSSVIGINDNCEELWDQLKKAQTTSLGKLRKDRNYFKMDLADCYRYLNNAWFPDGVLDVVSYKNAIYALAA